MCFELNRTERNCKENEKRRKNWKQKVFIYMHFNGYESHLLFFFWQMEKYFYSISVQSISLSYSPLSKTKQFLSIFFIILNEQKINGNTPLWLVRELKLEHTERIVKLMNIVSCVLSDSFGCKVAQTASALYFLIVTIYILQFFLCVSIELDLVINKYIKKNLKLALKK